MFKQHYDCLIAGLPDLVLNEYPKGLTSLKFRNELEEFLNVSDMTLVRLLFRENDHRNLLNLISGHDFQFDLQGNFKEDYLIRQIAEPTDIAPYLKTLITEMKENPEGQSQRSIENRLHELFYDEVQKIRNEFIRQWFSFEQNLRNVLAVFNCRQFGYELEDQLVPDEQKEGLNELLLKGNLRAELFIDEDISLLDQVLRILNSGADFSEREKALDQVKWAFLDEITTFNYFTIEKILSFVLKLKTLDRWRETDDATGKLFLKKLITDLEMSYTLV